MLIRGWRLEWVGLARPDGRVSPPPIQVLLPPLQECPAGMGVVGERRGWGRERGGGGAKEGGGRWRGQGDTLKHAREEAAHLHPPKVKDVAAPALVQASSLPSLPFSILEG